MNENKIEIMETKENIVHGKELDVKSGDCTSLIVPYGYKPENSRSIDAPNEIQCRDRLCDPITPSTAIACGNMPIVQTCGFTSTCRVTKNKSDEDDIATPPGQSHCKDPSPTYDDILCAGTEKRRRRDNRRVSKWSGSCDSDGMEEIQQASKNVKEHYTSFKVKRIDAYASDDESSIHVSQCKVYVNRKSRSAEPLTNRRNVAESLKAIRSCSANVQHSQRPCSSLACTHSNNCKTMMITRYLNKIQQLIRLFYATCYFMWNCIMSIFFKNATTQRTNHQKQRIEHTKNLLPIEENSETTSLSTRKLDLPGKQSSEGTKELITAGHDAVPKSQVTIETSSGVPSTGDVSAMHQEATSLDQSKAAKVKPPKSPKSKAKGTKLGTKPRRASRDRSLTMSGLKRKQSDLGEQDSKKGKKNDTTKSKDGTPKVSKPSTENQGEAAKAMNETREPITSQRMAPNPREASKDSTKSFQKAESKPKQSDPGEHDSKKMEKKEDMIKSKHVSLRL